MDMLTCSHVSKAFGKHNIFNNVLSDLTFSVPEHSIFGFIGQNGAGKTTTMKLILGLLQCDSGEIFVNGIPVSFGQNKTNRYIGYLPDVPEFYSFMTPMEYLMLCGEITGMEKKKSQDRADRLLHLVGLSQAQKRIQGFSRGMKQRLGIAQALLNSPKLLICDEPTSALDPLGRKEILDILCSVKNETTILFSTHILSDVERICDKIAFLNNGKIALQGTLEEIKGIRKGSGIEIEFNRQEDADLFAEKYKDGRRTGKVRVCCHQKTEKDMIEIMQLLTGNNISPQRIEMLEPALEDLFMEVVGE
ncbi:MAG: ABC transporter ATP-binding protein [Lachnospiraceae bacterium]|nr:ABC transporter ATP-binding protein [Lachnospiraceae bacterium]MCI9369774.1 ABC transporter ATP-binding protein [Lachnospiraceae bacterium]